MKKLLLNSLIGVGGFFIGYSVSIFLKAHSASNDIGLIFAVIGVVILIFAFNAHKKITVAEKEK